MVVIFAEPSCTAIDEFVALCERLAPDGSGAVLLIPPMEDLEVHTDDEEELADDVQTLDYSGLIQAYPFSVPQRIIADLLIAVDSGIVTLGQLTGGGIAFAVRGAAVCYAAGEVLILRYNTDALLITPDNKAAIFRHVGERLGTPGLYVHDTPAGLVPKPSAIDTPNQITDRCRNFVERMIQAEVLGLLAANNGGLLLIDGALTAGSYDTPITYLAAMLDFARTHAIDIGAISKRSGIMIAGRPIDALFDERPEFVGYAPLLPVIKQEREAFEKLGMRAASAVTAGTELYAVRFGYGPPGLTFRVDVHKSRASTNDDVINDLYNKCQMYGGYPRPPIEAHQYSSFLPGDAQTLLTDLVVRTGLRVKEQPSMNVLFQPFGAFGK